MTVFFVSESEADALLVYDLAFFLSVIISLARLMKTGHVKFYYARIMNLAT